MIQHLPDGKYRVVNMETKHILAKHTTKENAKKQVRLLQAVEHGFKPTGK